MKTCLFISLMSFPLTVAAQGMLSFATGYGAYSMKDLKSLEEEIHAGYPVSMKTLSSYPSYVNFEASFVYQSDNAFFWGGILGYGSTGGRVHYSDYSGFVRYDQLAKYFSVSASIGVARKYTSQKIRLCFDLRPGVIVTTFDLLYDYKLGASQGQEQNRFKSINVAVQPTASVSKKMGAIGIHALAGINVNVVRGNLRHKENKEAHLEASGRKLKADWSGLRAALGLSYYLGD